MATPKTTQPPAPVRAITGNMEDMDAAWLWLKASLSPLRETKPELYEAAIKRAPGLTVLLNYRAAVRRSQAGPIN
jgi:hypothetical protein